MITTYKAHSWKIKARIIILHFLLIFMFCITNGLYLEYVCEFFLSVDVLGIFRVTWFLSYLGCRINNKLLIQLFIKTRLWKVRDYSFSVIRAFWWISDTVDRCYHWTAVGFHLSYVWGKIEVGLALVDLHVDVLQVGDAVLLGVACLALALAVIRLNTCAYFLTLCHSTSMISRGV